MKLILASSSPYRRALLSRLQIDFSWTAPEIDETPLPGESPKALALRLSTQKAAAIAADNPGALVIGSDQVASVDGTPIGKPGTHKAAVAQLRASSGNSVTFFTGLAVTGNGHTSAVVDELTVHFRQLSLEEIEQYLRLETPYDCAGSFKCEGLGVALFDRLQGDDPTSLEGLPLIATCRLLRHAGFDVLAAP